MESSTAKGKLATMIPRASDPGCFCEYDTAVVLEHIPNLSDKEWRESRRESITAATHRMLLDGTVEYMEHLLGISAECVSSTKTYCKQTDPEGGTYMNGDAPK